MLPGETITGRGAERVPVRALNVSIGNGNATAGFDVGQALNLAAEILRVCLDPRLNCNKRVQVVFYKGSNSVGVLGAKEPHLIPRRRKRHVQA